MKRLLLLAAATVASCLTLNAQQTESSFYDDPRTAAELWTPAIEPDADLFFIRLGERYDIFDRVAFDFSAVRYRRRGYDFSAVKQYVAGLDLSAPFSGYPNYALLSVMRYLSAPVSSGRTLTDVAGGILSTDEFSIFPSQAPAGGRVSLSASDRSARFGIRASYCGTSRNGDWAYSAFLSRRSGRDMHIDGLFLDELSAALAVERKFTKHSSLALLLEASPTQRSSRAASTKEAFGLTGDNLYNPSWGWYDGKQRSSRVRKSFLPTAVLAYRVRIGQKSDLNASLGYTTGSESYSGLTWYDAQSPLPDYYRSMPSGIANPVQSAAVAQLWRSGDSRVTQLNWQEMAEQNMMGAGSAIYVEDAVTSKITSLQAGASIVTHPQKRLTVGYGLRMRIDRTENYDRVQDLLGAKWADNIDQYIIDDEYLGPSVDNDLRHPGRQVGKGEKFGYDYRLQGNSSKGFATLTYGDRGLKIFAAAEAGTSVLWREGLYEKELFPRSASFGPSEKFRFFEYTLKTAVNYALTPKHFLDFSVTYSNTAPGPDRIFLSPEYCNFTAGKPEVQAIFAAEAGYELLLAPLRLHLSGFYTRTSHGTEIFHYYDDISSTYCNLLMSGVAKKYYGLELSGELRISRRLSLLIAASAAAYLYDSDVRMDLDADISGLPVYTAGNAPMKNYRLGGTPQSVASGQLCYRAPHGWMATADVTWMGGNYISPDPTRRMTRATAYAASPENLEAMTAQERFAPSTILGLNVGKTFYIGRNTLMAMVSVDNLLGDKNIIYSGYEQMRMTRAGDGINRTYTPFASKYKYAYGRTWYCSVSYRF